MSEVFISCLCRAGFEADLAAELLAVAARLGARGLNPTIGKAVVRLTGKLADLQPYAQHWRTHGNWTRFPVFAREVGFGFARLRELPRHGRVERVIEAVSQAGVRCRDLSVFAPDHPELRPLEPLATSLQNHLRSKLELDPESREHLQVILIDSTEIWLALATSGVSAPWPAGVPRLKFPREAPSRSVLKLEEGMLALLSDSERRKWLKKGGRAVDLGAAPGGWTYQMVQYGMRVTAVDNGRMDPVLMAGGQVEHQRADGFKFVPAKAVDWLVCDMVEKPFRIAELTRRWLDQGWARRALVNLKLPMKQRVVELERCLKLFTGLEVRCKQLYHDREEVTLLVLA